MELDSTKLEDKLQEKGRTECKDKQQITHVFRSSHQIVFPVSIRVLYMMEIFIVILLKQQISTKAQVTERTDCDLGSTLSSEVKRFALFNFKRNAKNPENTFTHVFYQERRRVRLGHSVRSSLKNLSSTTNSRPLLLARRYLYSRHKDCHVVCSCKMVLL